MNKQPRILITGWFSFELPHNTAGDLLAKETAIKWAIDAGFVCDVAVPRPQCDEEVNVNTVDPADYIAVVFVCGPLTNGHIAPLMQKFKGIKRIALNVSVVPSSDVSSEFDIIIPRDAPGEANPDISLATRTVKTPVIGLIYVGHQKEYPTQQHELVEQLVEEVVREMDIAVVPIDTKLPNNEYGLSSISQIESVISSMDLVITTRLHGSLLSLRNGIPAISIDPVPSGAKVRSQMRTIGWPLSYTIDELNKVKLKTAIELALLPKSRDDASKLIGQAVASLANVRKIFYQSLQMEISK